jgi:hypothetical protein
MAASACRFALAHVNTEELAAKVIPMRDMRQKLHNCLHLAMAGKIDALNTLLAGYQLVMDKLLPQYRPVPKLGHVGELD